MPNPADLRLIRKRKAPHKKRPRPIRCASTEMGRGPDIEDGGQGDKAFDPLKRTMLQENPEDEVPSVVGTNSSAIPSR